MRSVLVTLLFFLIVGCTAAPIKDDCCDAPIPRVVMRSLVVEEKIVPPDSIRDVIEEEQGPKNRYENPSLRAQPRNDADN